VILRTVFPEVPPRVEYELTEFGRSLEPILLTMRDWGLSFQSRQSNKVEPVTDRAA